jgi:drug/metabolite transporter (DMT)-like permease
MLPVLFAAASALVWGTGDFCGGKATQRANALPVTVVSQLAALPVLAVCVALIPSGGPGPAALAWGTLAGTAGFGGILLLYRGLAQGAMAVFAPVTAVTSALVPLAVGLAFQRTPSPVALTGAVCAVVAIGLVSVSGNGHVRATPRLILLALAAGALFGLFFTVLSRAGSHAGMWPLVGVRLGSLAVGLLALAATRTPLVLPPRPLAWSVTAGVFDISANALYLAAATRAALSIVAPIAALYPVSTVLLALGVDRERVRPVQLAGLGLAATALVLVAS